MNNMSKVVISALFVSMLMACANKEIKDPSIALLLEKTTRAAAKAAAQRPEEAAVQAAARMAAAQAAADKAINAERLADNKRNASLLSERSVYYDLDKYDMRDEFTPIIEAHAKYLSGNAGANVIVQGNCDERGSREYNIALGHRRAESVRKMMKVLGVADNQIETVSFGEEKSRTTCREESCWSEDRRSDLVYKGE